MAKTRVPLPFPLRGLHESTGFDVQPPGTTTDALNVRAFCSLAGRARGGRRPGTSKYAYMPLNAESQPVQLLIKAVEGAEYRAPYETVDEDWSGYDTGTDTFYGERWVMWGVNRYWTGSEWAYNNSAGPGAFAVTADGLAWRTPGDDPDDDEYAMLRAVCLGRPAANDVEVTLRAKPDITSGNANFGGADEPTWTGPFINAPATMDGGFFACLSPSNTTTHAVRFAIYSMVPNESTGFQPYPNAVSPGVLLTLSGDTTVDENCRIRLWSVPGPAANRLTVYARLRWEGAGPGGADIDEQISQVITVAPTDTNQPIGQEGAGVGVFNPNAVLSQSPTFTDGAAFRTVARVLARSRTPEEPLVVLDWSVTDAGSRRYFRPVGLSAVYDDAFDGLLSVGGDGLDSNTEPTTEPYVDTTTPVFGSVSDALATLTRPEDAGVFDVAFVTGETGSTGDAWFRAEVGGERMVAVAWVHGIFNPAGVVTVTTRTREAGGNLIPGPSVSFPCPAGAEIRVEDRGSAVWVYANGRRVLVWVPPSEAPAFGTGITAGAAAGDLQAIRWVRRGGSARQVPVGSTTASRLLGVCGGSIVDLTAGVVKPIAGGAEVLTPDPFSVQAVSAFNAVFFTDGDTIQEYKLSTGGIATPTATAGAFPANPRLVALYRGRLVWSGTFDDPHNWFMSAVGNPYDYDYSPATPNETQAVAGNNSDAGLVGDVVNALVPFADDYMIFGCDHTIWMMNGDPAAGGVIDLVSDQTGMAFGSAWAKDPANTLYFWGTDGVYRMVSPTAHPENMTKNRIDFRLRTVDLAVNRVFMAWDYKLASLVILVQPGDLSEPVRVIVWESRTDAWWEDEYPITHGPNCLLAYDGAAPSDSAFLMGGRDAFVRNVDTTAATDDGYAISSRVRFAPFIAPDRASSTILTAATPVLAKGSAPVRLNAYAGQSAEGCATLTVPRASQVVAHAGRNSTMRKTVRGFAVQLEIAQPDGEYPWALESLVCEFDPAGVPTRHARAAGEGAAGGS